MCFFLRRLKNSVAIFIKKEKKFSGKRKNSDFLARGKPTEDSAEPNGRMSLRQRSLVLSFADCLFCSIPKNVFSFLFKNNFFVHNVMTNFLPQRFHLDFYILELRKDRKDRKDRKENKIVTNPRSLAKNMETHSLSEVEISNEN